MNLVKKYSNLISNNPKFILVLGLILTIIFIFGALNTQTKGMEYSEMLPQNLEEIQAYNFVSDEFLSAGSQLIVVINTNGTGISSDEIVDIRDARVIAYIDKITQKSEKLNGIVSADSLSNLLKEDNDGHLPKSTNLIISLMKNKTEINPSTIDVVNNLNETSNAITEINSGLNQSTTTLETIESGINSSSQGIKKISSALETIANQLGEEQDLSGIATLITMSENLDSLIDSTVLSTDPNFVLLKTYSATLTIGLTQIYEQMGTTTEGLQTVSSALNQSSIGLNTINSGLNQLETGTNSLKIGSAKLNSGLMQVNYGITGISQYINFVDAPYAENSTLIIDQYPSYISQDYSTTIIRLSLAKLNAAEKTELINELDQILQETKIPTGLESNYTGDAKVSDEIQNQIGPTMGSTATLSLLAILIIVILLFKSIRKGLISLIAIGLGAIWVFGTMGLLGMSLNSAMSGALSMIMGIGIDFGIQIVNRFTQERQKNNANEALFITIKNTWNQMLMTTLAALIGFRAMAMGQLTLLADLGNMMSLGILACFIIALTIIPAALILNDNLKLFDKFNLKKIILKK